MIEIKIKEKGTNTYIDFAYKKFTFAGGEEHVNMGTYKTIESANVFARIQNSSDVMTLLLINDVLDDMGASEKVLIMPYIPYARQDRRCERGDAFSLKVFADLINGMMFDRVISFDAHSDVAPALINNIRNFDLMTIVSGNSVLTSLATSTMALSPDAGSNKKMVGLSNFTSRSFIRADKIRDTLTGKITGTEVYADDLTGCEVTIWDDICDGGRTFIEIAKVLKSKGAAKVNLYVTHGIFSNGYEVIFESGIDNIITTDSCLPKEHPNVFIIKLDHTI